MPEADVEGHDRNGTTAGAIGRGEVEGIERARTGRNAEFGRPSTEGVVERHDERALPVALKGGPGHAELGLTEPTMERLHDFDKRVPTRDPLRIGQERGFRDIAVGFGDVPLDERAAVDVELPAGWVPVLSGELAHSRQEVGSGSSSVTCRPADEIRPRAKEDEDAFCP